MTSSRRRREAERIQREADIQQAVQNDPEPTDTAIKQVQPPMDAAPKKPRKAKTK